MMKANGTDKGRNDHAASLDRYLLMNEKEKDEEIQKAIIRLQKRIQEILFMLEIEKPRTASRTAKSRD